MHRSMRGILRGSKFWARLQDEKGSSLVELALILSLFGSPLLVGTAQLGMLVYDSIEVQNAANLAAMYGMQGIAYASDTTQMTTAAQAEAPDFGTSLTVTPTTYYACSSAVGGTQYTGANAQTNATAACTGGSNHPLQFLQVKTSVSVTPVMHIPGIPATITLNGTSVMEVEE